ncbi:MAG: protein kinase [Mollicutes bacterium]|nr:protein kinase [Mollicutes bacterium]MDD7263561.1 protein kinase [bacterium]MDY4979870.1 protein kinase [Candidatus Onthovivens sp.]
MIRINDIVSERYKIVATIGKGGMSNVYEARDFILKRNVAIKFLKPEALKKVDNIIRFQNEARFSSALNHPNIVKIYDYGEYDKTLFIVNEFVKGQTLRDSLDFKGAYTINEACSIMLQLCDSLIYIHSKKIIHRDIKSSNVYILPDGSVKIGDFGISILLDSNLNINENKKIAGTAQYLAPELVTGKAGGSYQSDIYALGILFFELITGNVPFDGDNPNDIAIKHVKEVMPSPLKIIPSLPKEAEKIFFKAVDKDLRVRYKTVKQMRDDILNLYKNKKAMKQGRSLLARIFGLSSN